MVIFLTRIDFSISMISLNLHDLEHTFRSLRIIGKTCFFWKQKSGSVPEKIFATTRRRICNFYKNELVHCRWKRPKLFSLILHFSFSRPSGLFFQRLRVQFLKEPCHSEQKIHLLILIEDSSMCPKIFVYSLHRQPR